MIEPTNGAGLSGITGKSGVLGENSLFAKLLAMLEKQTASSGKGLQLIASKSGKGLQLIASESGKGLQLIASESGKGKIAVSKSDKSEALFLAKSKLLLALAAKEKSAGKAQAEETATPLVSAVAIIEPVLMHKMTIKDGKVSVLLSQQQGDAKGDQANPVLKQGLQSHTGAIIGKTSEALLTMQSKTGISASANAVVETDQPLATFDKPQLLKHTAEASVNAQQFVQTGDSTAGKQKLSALQTNEAQNIAATAQTKKSPVKKLDGQLKAETVQAAAANQPQQDKIPQAPLGQNAATSMQAKNSLGNQTDGQPKAETVHLAAGAQLQQGKSSQASQARHATTAAVVSTAEQLNISNLSLANSDSQFSDKGSQDAHSLPVVNGEAKTSGSATVTNFQSYVSRKASPSMSVFDSMQHIAQSARNGQTRLEIQLEPANLGKIHISLQIDASKQLQVHLIVDQGATRQVIEQHLPALKSALAQQGLDLSGFSMGSHKDGTSFGSNAHQQSNTFTNSTNSALADSAPATHALQTAGQGTGRLSIHV